MLFPLSTRFPCSGEGVVFQETQGLEISQLLGENLSHLPVLCAGMNLAVPQLREFHFPLCLCLTSVQPTPQWQPQVNRKYIGSSHAWKWPLKAEACSHVLCFLHKTAPNTDVIYWERSKQQKYICTEHRVYECLILIHSGVLGKAGIHAQHAGHSGCK